MSWTTHFKGEIGHRAVVVETHLEGGYRVLTTADESEVGESYQLDEGTFVAGTSHAEGDMIEIEGDAIGQVRTDLADAGFDEHQINEIVGYFPS